MITIYIYICIVVLFHLGYKLWNRFFIQSPLHISIGIFYSLRNPCTCTPPRFHFHFIPEFVLLHFAFKVIKFVGSGKATKILNLTRPSYLSYKLRLGSILSSVPVPYNIAKKGKPGVSLSPQLHHIFMLF